MLFHYSLSPRNDANSSDVIIVMPTVVFTLPISNASHLFTSSSSLSNEIMNVLVLTFLFTTSVNVKHIHCCYVRHIPVIETPWELELRICSVMVLGTTISMPTHRGKNS